MSERGECANFLGGAAEIQGLGATLSIRAAGKRDLHSPPVGLSPFYTSNIMSASLAPECNEVKEYVNLLHIWGITADK